VLSFPSVEPPSFAGHAVQEIFGPLPGVRLLNIDMRSSAARHRSIASI
jgi:hypothetical protein